MKENSIILIADPKILLIPIIDNGESLVDISNQSEIVFGSSPEIPNNTDYTKMRKTVFDKLIQAQKKLPQGLRFCLYEAYRSLSLQKMLFDARFAKVKNQNPNWNSDDIFIETIKLVSPLINQDGSKNVPPHATGGAVDLYLIDEAGQAVDMGIHPKDWMDDVTGSLSITASTLISSQAQNYRKIMSAALSAVGFVNYPTEYWHWSYGDRYWAFYKNESNAIYNFVS